jgi:hypothetical protein
MGRKTYRVKRPVEGYAPRIEDYEASRASVSQCGALALYAGMLDTLVVVLPPGQWLEMKPVEDDVVSPPEESATPQPQEVLFPVTRPSRPPEEIRQAVLDTMSEKAEG